MYLIHSSGDPVPALHSTDLRDAELAKGMDAADVTVQTVAGSDSGGPLLTPSMKTTVVNWLKARTQTATPPTENPPPAANPPTPRTAPGRTTQSPYEEDSVPPPPAGNTPHAAAVTLTTGTYAYGTDPEEQLDAYYVHATKKPALVIIHGGYWYEGDKSDWTATAKWYAERGYAVFSIGYRFNSQTGWTAQRTDALNAIAWIRAHATTFSTDPNRVVLLGSSAGGQIATAIGTYGTGTKYVRGVVALSPVASPTAPTATEKNPARAPPKQKLRDNSTLLARCYPTKTDTTCWNRWTDAVVKNHASTGDAPMDLFHSQGDFVPSAHSADLCTALKAKRSAAPSPSSPAADTPAPSSKPAASTPKSSPGSRPTTDRPFHLTGQASGRPLPVRRPQASPPNTAAADPVVSECS